MKNLYCPAYIEALLHCHCSPEPLREAPVNEAAVKLLESSGMITPRVVPAGHPQTYTTTPLGAAYVDSLCLLPPPSAVYVDVLGNQFPPHK